MSRTVRTGLVALTLACFPSLGLASAEPLPLTLHGPAGADTVHLRGPDARQQLVALAGSTDLTREIHFAVEPPDVASVDSTGFLTPLADGSATVFARHETAGTASLRLLVEDFTIRQPVSFANDVVPIFTRQHCNAGACHAKAAGQNGFQLSLLGYDPALDFDQLVRNARGRRVFPGAPELSLLLLKPTGDVPHEGGARIDKDSGDYAVLHRWIAEGMPYQPDTDPRVERIEIFPRRVVVRPGSSQQLSVAAFFQDGSVRDITRAVQYESNQPATARPDEHGRITFSHDTGTTSVLVRFQEHIDVFQATIPLGHPVVDLPAPANFIDERIHEQLRLLGLPPSGSCDDATFLRRVTLDIAGRLPTGEETEAFLADAAPDKRARRIDALLDTTDYADLFAGKWAGILRNKVAGNSEWITRDSYAFHAWIRSSFLENKPFDRLAAELVTASGKMLENPAVSWFRVVTDQKEQMQDISQVFLGVRMQCAQCHHHPYERWSQDDYYAFAAFFSTVQRKKTPKLPEEDIVYHKRTPAGMKNPVTGTVLPPRLLGAAEPLSLPVETDPRLALAEWLGDPENPWFARVLANRYWKHFFGRGLVEPEDDIRPTNPATHPELLDDLARHVVASGFDLKELVRVLCNSHTYQLDSTPTEENAGDERNYARFHPRRLPAEVLLDAINDVTGARNSFNQLPDGLRAIALPNEQANQQSEFLTMFGRPQMDTACECERTGEANLGQSLHLINSDAIQTKLKTPDGRAARLAKQPDRPDDERIDELYLVALTRKPLPEERAIARSHLDRKRALSAADPAALPLPRAEQEAFEDILWVLFNTKEFLFTH